jgi:protein gp37
MYRDSLNGTRYDAKQVLKTKTVFNLPLKLKEPSKIFTSSLTDFFHPDIDSYRGEAWEIIRKCPHHTFQILTKRPERIKDNLPADWGIGWHNVWLGTSIGTQAAAAKRVAYLLEVPALVRFLSIEPLTGHIDLTHIDADGAGHPNYCQINCLNGRQTDMARPCRDVPKIDWVIVGAESGNDNGQYRYRECKIEWIESIVDHCKSAGIPVFVKHLGTHLSKKLGLKDRHGGDMEEWPEHLRIREFPAMW